MLLQKQMVPDFCLDVQNKDSHVQEQALSDLQMHLLLMWEVISLSQPETLTRDKLQLTNNLNGWNYSMYSQRCILHKQLV